MTALQSLFLLGLVCLVRAQKECQIASDDQLEEESNAITTQYNELSNTADLTFKQDIGRVITDDGCSFTEPSDASATDVAKTSRAKRQTSWVTYQRGTCEACPPRERFLGRFFGRCYVIASRLQQVRYVTCPRQCKAPCMCSASFCQRTHWIRVWFFSFCFPPAPAPNGFPQGYTVGLNFRFLWLPQDCTCRNV